MRPDDEHVGAREPRPDAGHRYDGILCDMLLGDSSGQEFYERLLTRAVDQAARVLFMSGMGPGDDAFGRATKHRHLMKPMPLDVLRLRIEYVAGAVRLAS